MAFPTTISTAGNVSDGGGTPFLSSGGNVYVILTSTTNQVKAFKATDPTSSFSGVGSDITVTSTHNISGLDAYQDGDNIHVVSFDRSTTTDGELRYHIFSMSSDSWTTTNETIVTGVTSGNSSAMRHCHISMRSDGDVIVLYNKARVANMGSDRERVGYARRESGSWTVDVAVDNGGATDWRTGGIVAGSSDRHHFWFIDTTNVDAYQRCLRSANTLETFPSSFDTTSSNIQESFISQGHAYDSSGTFKVFYPIVDSGNNLIDSPKLYSADSPTVSVDADITGSTVTFTNNPNLASFRANGTTLWHTFVDTNQDIYTQSSTDEAAWSAPSSFYTGTAENIYTNIYTRGGDIVLAMVFGETNPKYHEKVLVQGGNAFSMSAAASATFTGASTAAVPFTQTAVATLTMNGKSTATSNFNQAAVASVTWNGKSTAASNMDGPGAAALLTWNGASTAAVPFTLAAVATVTWNGISTAASSFSAAAAASVTWNGASTATSSLSAAAAASLTWQGTGLYPGAWSSTAAASVTWNGQEVAGGTIASADWSVTSAAALTWNGVSTASADLSSAAAASVTWNGISTATSNWNSIAAAALTWNGTSTATGALNSAAVASLTWNGNGFYSGAWSATAAGSLTMTGASTASADLASNALATLTWNGAAIATAAWNSAAVALVQWNSGGTLTSGEFSIIAAAVMTMTGASTASGSLSAAAAAALTWNGTGLYPSAWSSAAAASLAAAGAATAAGAFTSSALANLQALGASTASGDWLASAAGNLADAGASTVAGAIIVSAAASLTWTGQEVGGSGAGIITMRATLAWAGEELGGAGPNLDGWLPDSAKRERQDQQDMEDIAYYLNAYLREYYGYH